MSRILVAYSTTFGTTEKLARAVAEGAGMVEGARVTLKPAPEVTAEDLLEADAHIFGTPIHMGSIDWQIKKMIDTVAAWLWGPNRLVGKVGAVFTSSSGIGNAGSGAELAMVALLAHFAEQGMILVPLPKNTPGYFTNGLHWGPTAITGEHEGKPIGVPDEQLLVARHHGMNVARVAAAVAGKQLLNP
jgi:NAD(P)H dehydrogenase (quinone)